MKEDEEGREKIKREKRPWLWRVEPKQGEVWAVGRANTQDPQHCKRWVGLRLKEQKGPRRAPHTPGLRGRGTSPGSPAGFLGLSGWG